MNRIFIEENSKFYHISNKAIFTTKSKIIPQEIVELMYVDYVFCNIRCPKLTSLLHSHNKLSSSTCPSCRLIMHARPDNLLAIRPIGPSKWIHSIHWSREFTGSFVIFFANVCDNSVILDYLIMLKIWDRILQINMEGNSTTFNASHNYESNLLNIGSVYIL